MSSQAPAERPAMMVDVPVGDASADQVLGALDAVLGGDTGGVEVRLLVGDADPALAELCAADPRLRLVAADADPEPCAVRVILPPAARPSPRTLAEIRELLVEGSAGAIEVAVPGRLGVLGRTAFSARLAAANRVRAERPGATGRTARVSARRVGLGSARTPVSDPPPAGGLSDERAEHLRHRARSASGRARLDRNAQRLTRERMRAQHERTRASLLDERLAEVSPRHRVGRSISRARRMAVAVPLRLWSLLGAGRVLYRRARRFARDRIRRRRSPTPRG